jgi:UDP-glucose:(heptosyl)LPS alpha-1,3-glucosyltransferase
MSLRILYIVRTFGPVGGMERYVFETAREMAARGHAVCALARFADERLAAEIGVEVRLVDPTTSPRGWKDRYLFRDEVTEFFSAPGQRDSWDIVHSHENTIEQDVSTEHGPCTAYGLRRAPWKFLDPSARKNLAIERQKFSGPWLASLASCSRRVEEIALREYPALGRKLNAVITPAYSYLGPIEPQRNGRTLGFMGRDWKRKGLPKAVEVFRRLRGADPTWRFLVAGCPGGEPPESFRRAAPEGTEFLGRMDPAAFFAAVDVLVHPARDEPFGMVVSEALTCGVPVVASDQCGCVDHLHTPSLTVLPLAASPARWAEACAIAAGSAVEPIPARTWADVAVEHEQLYARILQARGRAAG